MSKRISRAFASLLCALALAASLLPTAHAPASAQVATKPAVGANAASVAAATAEVLRETSEIRQLPVLRPVKSGAQSRAEIEQMLLRNLDEESKPEEMRASELTMKKLGMLPADFQLRPFLVSVLTEQILGYYDPKSQTFYLADWIDLEGQQPVISHELTHALQDQHFNLRRFDHWKKGDADAELAAHALVEGDATWEMTLYVLKDARRALAMLKSVGTTSTTKIDSAPSSLRASLLFPYEQGMTWTRQLYQRGGWKAVDEAFTNLPQSTEQILHAEKYFAHEVPVRVDIPDLAPTLGKGWRRIDYDVNGEWGYYLILNEFLKDENESRKAAAGWGGDRYALYENAQTHETMLAQVTIWDTETDAREFFDAYCKRTQRRYGTNDAGCVKTTGDDPTHVTSYTSEGKSTTIIERRDSRILILEGLPAEANPNTVLKLMRGAS